MIDMLLPRAEKIRLELRGLFEGRGYCRCNVDRFEPYEMYTEHRRFLKGSGVITFTDTAGRLMALKPDVTLGIVKNAPVDETAVRKYYYNESVFRIAGRGEEYREIDQWGIEYIGADSDYAQAEVVILSIKALSAIEEDFVLDISHMGFLSALFDALGADRESAVKLLDALRRKNVAELMRLASDADETNRNALMRAASFRGTADELPNMRLFCVSPQMTCAFDEIMRLASVLKAVELDKFVKFDFSVVNDLDYYNGIVFRGFVRGVQRAVLSGGRYDNLLKLFGKPQKAVGFALYLSELDRLLFEERSCDADILLLYGEEPAEIAAVEAERLSSLGYSVRVERTAPVNFKAREIRTVSKC